jgi:hypothetical protein
LRPSGCFENRLCRQGLAGLLMRIAKRSGIAQNAVGDEYEGDRVDDSVASLN